MNVRLFWNNEKKRASYTIHQLQIDYNSVDYYDDIMYNTTLNNKLFLYFMLRS